MARYARSIFNVFFILPLMLSWVLLCRSYIIHHPNFFEFLNIQPLKEWVQSLSSKKMEIKADAEVSYLSSTEEPFEESFEGVLVHHYLKAKSVLEQIKNLQNQDLRRRKSSLRTPQKALNSSPLNTEATGGPQDTAPDYDETLYDIAPQARNDYPLVAKFINTIFSRNVMRLAAHEGKKAMAIKGEALLTNGASGIVISQTNLRFLERSFMKFKDRFGLEKIVLTAPSQFNESYLKKIHRFVKNYFNEDVEVMTEVEPLSPMEVIFVGVQK